MSLAPNNPSAGVYTSERVIPERNGPISVSTGVIVTACNRGRIMERTRVSDKAELRQLFGKLDPKTTLALNCAEHFLEDSNALYITRVARNTRYAGVLIKTVSNFATTVKLNTGIADPFNVVMNPDDIMLIYADNQGEWGNDVYVIMYPDVNDPDNHQFILEIFEGDSTVPSERYTCTSFYKRSDQGSQLFVDDVVNSSSRLIKVRSNQSHVVYGSNPTPLLVNAVIGGSFDPVTGQSRGQLSGGTNGTPATTGDLINGWYLYEDHEEVEVDILMSAGYTDLALLHTINDIAARRMDCIAVLDTPFNIKEATDLVNFRRDTLNLNSSHAALYAPWIKARDTDAARSYFVPLSGKVGGVYARTDRIAASWFAPAGNNRAILSGVEELSKDYDLDDRNMLSVNQVNYARTRQGNGTVLWLADTMYANGGALQDIGVRRLLGILHRITRFNQLRAVFEPNDDFLQRQIRDDMISLLEPIRIGRGLDWYEVVCDARNNPAVQVANGDLVCDIYLDPTRYTKRIHLTAVIPKKGAIKFAEEAIER